MPAVTATPAAAAPVHTLKPPHILAHNHNHPGFMHAKKLYLNIEEAV
jgi:hypothetical protein